MKRDRHYRRLMRPHRSRSDRGHQEMRLERQCRRLMRLFPARWRESFADDLVGTLLEGARTGQTSMTWADRADLIRGAAVVRFRSARSRLSVFDTSIALTVMLVAATVVATQLRLLDVGVEFLVTSLVVIVIPGTGVVYTVSSSLYGGWRRGLFAAVGCTLGIVPHLLAAMLGLSGVMQAGAVAFEAVRWAGVAYLAFMGLSMIASGGGLRFDDQQPTAVSMSAVVRRGILLNLLNPKLTVFFFAFLPQFLSRDAGPLDPALIGLSAVFMVLTLAVFVAYAKASATFRSRVLGAPSIVRWVQRSLGLLLIGFAARLAVDNR